MKNEDHTDVNNQEVHDQTCDKFDTKDEQMMRDEV